jgi:glucosyl-dolichyl phosphate glucuronosyltransferase
MTEEQMNAMRSVTTARAPRATAGSQPQTAMSAAVVIPAYTMDRWSLLVKAVESLKIQTVPANEIVLCIDNNDELLQRARDQWPASEGTAVTVIPNLHSEHLTDTTIHEAIHGTKRRFGAGMARNTAAETVKSDIIAFMDDDAHAEPDWIEALLRVFERPSVVAVGGPPLPDYETARPSWFPGNFDWVFGCAYDGLPTTVSPLRHLIGANMAVRRTAWEAVGGFLGSDFDDLNMCMRLLARFGVDSVMYTPFAVVHHFVPANRVTWRYFWRRCYFVNREKVAVFRQIGSAANLVAEREFVIHALTAQARRTVREVASGRFGAVRVLAAMLTGISLAGLGHARGRIDLLARRLKPGRAG